MKGDAINNGGNTDYYALPLPDKEELYTILDVALGDISTDTILRYVVDEFIKLCPQTLNDLIEYKKMQPWQHEVMKACYAMPARATKNGGSFIREINKVLYYAERGKNLYTKKEFIPSKVFTPREDIIKAQYDDIVVATDSPSITRNTRFYINDTVFFTSEIFITRELLATYLGIVPSCIKDVLYKNRRTTSSPTGKFYLNTLESIELIEDTKFKVTYK